MKIRFAQYGVAHAHAAGKAAVLKTNPDVEFCGVYEPDPAARRERGRNDAYRGVHWFATEGEILDDETIVAVAVEGAVSENLRIARRALERGKHVWLDKPAGTDWGEFQDLIALARQNGLLVQLGYMFRYNAGFQFSLDWAREGRLGDVFCVRGRMSTHLDEERRERLSVYQGGILFELLCHLIDIVVALLGRPNRVTSYLRNDMGTARAFKDNTLTVFEYPRAMATLGSAAIEVSPFPSRRLEVYGTRGSAILEPFEAHPRPGLRLCLDQDRDGFVKGWQQVPIAFEPRYAASLAALVADIRGEKQPDRSLDHELTVQETVLRAAGVLE
jgi:predicted dehydrogenase